MPQNRTKTYLEILVVKVHVQSVGVQSVSAWRWLIWDIFSWLVLISYMETMQKSKQPMPSISDPNLTQQSKNHLGLVMSLTKIYGLGLSSWDSKTTVLKPFYEQDILQVAQWGKWIHELRRTAYSTMKKMSTTW